MGYAVYHTEKGTSNSGGIGNHIDRKKGHEYSYQHADPERTHLNQVYRVHQDRQNLPLSSAIDERIKEAYKGKRAIRKDAVKFTTHILTGSHEDMKKIFADKEKAKEWINENYKFIAKEFGKENIVRFSLHLDEKTPHIHAVTVPMTADGRLSAKEVIGNRTTMRDRQDRYAQQMQKFGLERGIRSTGIKHENAREYYARMEKTLEQGNQIDDLTAKKKVLGVEVSTDKDKTIENYKSALKRLKTAQISAERKKEQTEKKLTEVKRTAERHKNNFEVVVNHKEKFEEVRENRLKQAERDVLYEVKRGVDYKFGLHKLSPEERQKLAFNIANKKINDLNLKGDLLKELVNRKDFAHKVVNVVEKRAEKNLNRSQNRRQDRGMSM